MKSILVFMFLMVMVTVSILYMIKPKPKEKLVSFSPNIITINDKIEDRYRQFLSKIDKYRINGSKKYISSFILFEKYGIENCNIYLVELHPCDSKEQLLAREGYNIKNNKCIHVIQ